MLMIIYLLFGLMQRKVMSVVKKFLDITALLKSVKFSSIGHSFKKSIPNYFALNRNRNIAYALMMVISFQN